MSLRVSILSIVLFFASTTGVFSQIPEAKLAAEQDTMLIGDQQWFTLTIEKPNSGQIQAPILDQQTTEGLEIIQGPLLDTLKQNAKEFFRYRYKITSFTEGNYKVSGLPVLYHDKGKTDTIYTASVSFRVNSVEVDTAKTIKPIKAPIEAPITFAEALPFILIGLGVILLGVIIYFLVLRLKRKQSVLPRIERPLEPAHTEARKALKQLQERDLIQKDKIKVYYTELSEIVRKYIWRQMKVKTLEKTSMEIFDGLDEVGFKNREALKSLRSLFTTADLVKFAKYQPESSDHESCMKEAYSFIDLTEPKKRNKEEANTSEDNASKSLGSEASDTIKEEGKL